MDEIWTTRDGREIRVSDMEPAHVLNTLRMLERKGILRNKKPIPDNEAAQRMMLRAWCLRAREALHVPEMSHWDYKDASDARAYRDLANSDCYFPLLNGGSYGSPALQAAYGRSIFSD